MKVARKLEKVFEKILIGNWRVASVKSCTKTQKHKNTVCASLTRTCARKARDIILGERWWIADVQMFGISDSQNFRFSDSQILGCSDFWIFGNSWMMGVVRW